MLVICSYHWAMSHWSSCIGVEDRSIYRAGGYSLLANAIHTRQIYSTMAIKSGHVIAGKVIMTVEVAGLKGSGRWCKTISVCLISLSSHNNSLCSIYYIYSYSITCPMMSGTNTVRESWTKMVAKGTDAVVPTWEQTMKMNQSVRIELAGGI